MAIEKFNTLAIDPELDNRIRIKQVTSNVHVFGAFFQASSLDEGMAKLNGADRIDTIFVSERFSGDEILPFVKAAKNSKWGSESTFILLVQDKEKLKTCLAQNMVAGIDGFLCEPYSVESLTEIAQLATRLKKERSDAKEIAAIKFLMQQISEQISIIAQLKTMNLSAMRETRKLLEMSEIFKSLDEEKKQRYLNVAVDVFQTAPLPKPVTGVKSYGGISSRVKKRMEDKILKQLANNSGSSS